MIRDEWVGTKIAQRDFLGGTINGLDCRLNVQSPFHVVCMERMMHVF